MTLYVVRHGRTEANASGLLLGRADPALDRVGRMQAAKIAEAVGQPRRVITSPLQRCVETAEVILGDPELDDRLGDEVSLDNSNLLVQTLSTGKCAVPWAERYSGTGPPLPHRRQYHR